MRSSRRKTKSLLYPMMNTSRCRHRRLAIQAGQTRDLLESLEYGKAEPAAAGTVRQTITIKQGIDRETAKVINTMIRDSKLKVKRDSRRSDRVSGKSKDDLQRVMAMCREADLPVDVQFV